MVLTSKDLLSDLDFKLDELYDQLYISDNVVSLCVWKDIKEVEEQTRGVL